MARLPLLATDEKQPLLLLGGSSIVRNVNVNRGTATATAATATTATASSSEGQSSHYYDSTLVDNHQDKQEEEEDWQVLLELEASTTNDNNSNVGNTANKVQVRHHMDIALLFVVAVLYGTLNVSLRGVYDQPDPPSASALSTIRGWLAVVGFGPMLLWQNHHTSTTTTNNNHYTANTKANTNTNTNTNKQEMWKVATELALWNFGAQALVNIGLVYIESARAAFLTQLSVVMTPCLAACAGHKIKPRVWWACACALVGLILLSEKQSTSSSTTTTTDSTSHSSSFNMTFSVGDVLCLCGALSWSTYIYRLSAVGVLFDELQLQAHKNVILAIFYTAWLLFEIVVTQERQWLGATDIVAWLLLGYSALGPGCIADVLQQKAQTHVPAPIANIILSSEPVFTALFGRFLLGEETTWMEKCGGCCILMAAMVATTGP